MDPVRELPYWPAAMALLIEAGQMTASDYLPTYPDLLLASEGASTDAVRSSHRKLPRLLSSNWDVSSIQCGIISVPDYGGKIVEIADQNAAQSNSSAASRRSART